MGVDGGNSKAIALVARRDGSIIGAARRPGSADIYAGESGALELLHGVVADALADAGAASADVEAAAFSLAGADWPEDLAFLRSALGRPLELGVEPIVVNDAIGALIGAVPDGPAVVVSLGTGAATGARAADGGTWHSSFWQVTQGRPSWPSVPSPASPGRSWASSPHRSCRSASSRRWACPPSKRPCTA